MNTRLCMTGNAMVMAPCDMTELVRGQEEQFVDRMAPLVRQQSVALDLDRVERIDAAGIAALISLYGAARDAGHAFGVANPSAHVREILSLVGLDRILLPDCESARMAELTAA
jgi:anti-anti-sigma factor